MKGTKTEVRRGVWRLRVVTGYNPRTGNPQQTSRTVYGTKKAADEALSAPRVGQLLSTSSRTASPPPPPAFRPAGVQPKRDKSHPGPTETCVDLESMEAFRQVM